MKLNKSLVLKHQHQKREVRLAVHYASLSKPKRYSVYNFEGFLQECGLTIDEASAKGYLTFGYSLQEEK